MSLLAILANRTPFSAMHCLLPDGQGGELILAVVKASFVIDERGEPTLADEQVEVRLAAEPAGDPKRGVTRWDADLVPVKPRVDLLLGEAVAYAPRGRAAEQFFVELQVGEDLSKSLLISGDRFWDGEAPSRPQAIETMPIVWERAFGGTRSRERVDERNPVGVGFAGARSADPDNLSALPNVEAPDAVLTRPGGDAAPAGFGTVGRAWLPRRLLAGTFDEGWKRRRWPLAPRDFSPGFYQSAPADQQLARYPGGAPVRLVNLTPEGEWQVRLPTLDVPVHLLYADRRAQLELCVDTVEIEPEATPRRVVLTGRVAISVNPRAAPLEQIVLGHATRAWLEARRTGKCYVDLREPAAGRACFR